MSIKNREVPFSFDDGYSDTFKLTGIIELGFNERGIFVISAYTTPRVSKGKPRGSYHTSLPLSPKEWRREHGQGQSGYRRSSPHKLFVWDDYGNIYSFYGLIGFIDTLKKECIANELGEKL